VADDDAGAAGRRAQAIEAAALAYAARGWSVIPIEAKGKRPLAPWLDYQDRIAAPAEIRSWFRQWPDANVGIVTGHLSGIVVIDVDSRHGGHASLAALQDEHGVLPRTIEATTGGGGRHLYFAHPTGALRNRVGIRSGIDLRAEGGYVVAPPSVHASGRRYEWLAGAAPGERAAALLPEWFVERTRVLAHAEHGLRHWRRLVHEGVEQGERNTVLASFTGHLLWRGVDPEVALELMLAWNRMRCRPPLPDEEVARVVQSIVRLHERERDPEAAARAP
jgi:hypothetical protein